MSVDVKDQENLLPEEVQTAIKKRGRGSAGFKNNPYYDSLAGTGENTRYINFMMEARKLPWIHKGDKEKLMERIDWYFNYCAENDMKPTLSGLAAAIGVARKTLWEWKNGINRPENFPIIEEAYNRMEELWEMYMLNGKINPASGIFLGKNNFDYKDVQDVVVTPKNPLGDARSADEIAEQYEYLPEG